MFVLPEERAVRRVVAVPALVLAAGQRVEIDDRVEPVSRAALDRPIEQPESVFPQLEGTQVVLEVSIAHRQPDDVEPQRGDERRVLVAEEHVEEAVEEALRSLLAQRPAQGRTLQGLGGGEAGDEVFHVHPAPQADATQHHGATGARHDLAAAGLEQDVMVHAADAGP